MADRDVQLSMETARPAAEVATGKTIVLFSDGTGNSSGKQHKTNVWRMYQAIDLGVPQERNQRVQIGRYDNGVGNSTMRLLAMLQGIFGWGLKRNVLSLYLFLCRNYSKGDSICLFGFSRGAYTVRILADLIDNQGIIPCQQSGMLEHLVRDAYRCYRRRLRPRMWPMRWLVPLWKWAMVKLRTHRRYDRDANHKPPIDFVGVWDTVGAYGGPILEVVRGVDDWIMPISFANTKLPACVKAARHALALDDERDSFQPIPWDEGDESRERLQQVWFAGMHSDVGGGYPDDSLAYVSLVWMLDEARACARLRFRPDREQEARLQADSFGPIHESRAGLAAYYRYQPRRISALMWPQAKGTESLADPEQPEGQGMRRPALVHDSVFRRILSGTDRYAPIAITRPYQIVSDRSAKPALGVPEAERSRFCDPKWQRRRDAAQERVWDIVWKRRIVYFLIVFASLMVAALPTLISSTGLHVNGVATHLIGTPWRWVAEMGLGTSWWLDALIAFPWLPPALAIVILLLFRLSGMLEKSLRRSCRLNWRAPLEPAETVPPSLISRFRSHWFYQDIIGFMRWNLLPSVFGILMLAALISAFLSAGTIGRLTWNEWRDTFCGGTWPAGSRAATIRMATANPCNRTPIRVERGRRYDVVLVVPGRGWQDGGVPTDPAGRAGGSLPRFTADLLFAGMQRHPSARWMQPLAYIVADNGHTTTQPIHVRPEPEPSADGPVYRGSFVAESQGSLALAVNDAIPPWPLRRGLFYDTQLSVGAIAWSTRNRGRACVLIVPAGGDTTPPPCARRRRGGR